jgi:modulator of FtsH protease HflK
MPWNKDDDGKNQPSGDKPPTDRGPWGKPPGNDKPSNKGGPNWGGGNRGSGPGLPPDLDGLLKKGKESFNQILPQGGGRGTWLIPLVALAAFWVYNSVYQVQADQRGVVLRFGAYDRTTEPGLHFAFWPFETIETPRVGAVNQFSIASAGNEDQMLTSDKNIIGVPFSVFWRISDPKNYLFNLADQERTIKAISQSALREVVGQRRAQEILTSNKEAIAAQVLQITQQLLDEYNSGIVVTTVNLGEVHAPAEVADAFAEVVRAGQNKQQLINEAELYRNQQVRLAEGNAAKLVEEANGYKAKVVAEAQGDASRFLSIYDQYKVAKDVTRDRLFLETMEQVMGQSNKIIIEGGKDGSGVVPYLPLPSIQPRDASKAGDAQ